MLICCLFFFFFFQAEDGIRDVAVTGVQTCALPISSGSSDDVLYAPGDVTGSRTGSPNSSGLVAELTHQPWQNTRFALQYVYRSEERRVGKECRSRRAR